MRLRGELFRLSDPGARRFLPGLPPGDVPSLSSRPSMLYMMSPPSMASTVLAREKQENKPIVL